MGQWSTRHDYYVHQFDNPRVQQCSKTMIINVKNAIGQNIFQPLVSSSNEQQPSQQIVIISISVASIQNEYPVDVTLFLNNLFPQQPAPIRLLCPANYSDVLDATQRVLYQNTVKTDKILLYSGLNATILTDTSTDNSDSECFPDDHPIVQFIETHGSVVKSMIGDGDVQKKDGKSKPFYIIKKEALGKIRAFFETKVFNEIHYTRFEDSKLSGDIPEPNDKLALSIILNLEYAIVNPGNGSLFRMVQKLN